MVGGAGFRSTSDDMIIAFDLRSQVLPLAYIFAIETKLPQTPRHARQAPASTRPTSVSSCLPHVGRPGLRALTRTQVVEDAGDTDRVIGPGSADEILAIEAR